MELKQNRGDFPQTRRKFALQVKSKKASSLYLWIGREKALMLSRN
jgi:hypothetical protein